MDCSSYHHCWSSEQGPACSPGTGLSSEQGPACPPGTGLSSEQGLACPPGTGLSSEQGPACHQSRDRPVLRAGTGLSSEQGPACHQSRDRPVLRAGTGLSSRSYFNTFSSSSRVPTSQFTCWHLTGATAGTLSRVTFVLCLH